MKLLYLSAHEILEFDEVSLFLELGLDVFSYGAYIDPNTDRTNLLRPHIPNLKYTEEDMAAYHSIGARGFNRDNLPKDFIDRFDIIYVMHSPEWIYQNWHNIKHKIVIFRTIGQCVERQEQLLVNCRKEGLKIVRYSPMERKIPSYLGEDAGIRFYKDPAEFFGWNGKIKEIITLGQSMPERGEACNYEFFEMVTKPFPRKLFGPGNDKCPFWGGKLTLDELKKALRNHRVYFYCGTHPAPYTLNFIESWMSGIPILAIGPENGNAHYFPNHRLYEVDSLIENGVNGFCSDSVSALRAYIHELFYDYNGLARNISINGRKRAIELFGKETIKKNWEEFFRSLGAI
ncbi:MAG: hypothetical protein AABY22_24975 [Nanoarchaeota archaeon]